MIHSDPMNPISLHTPTEATTPEASMMEELAKNILILGWIWSAGEDQYGHWCELYTPQENMLFRGSSLQHVLSLALQYTQTRTLS